MFNVDGAALEAVLKDEVFVKNLLTLETPEEARAAFAAKGIEFTIDEVKEIAVAMQSELESMAGKEFSEEDLENVAGGAFITGITAIGIAKLVIGIGTMGLAVYDAIKAKW